MNNLARKHRISVPGWGCVPPVELSIWGGVLAGVVLGGLVLAGWFSWQNRHLPAADAGIPVRNFGPNSLGIEFREILFRPGIFMACREVTAGNYSAYLRDSGVAGKPPRSLVGYKAINQLILSVLLRQTLFLRGSPKKREPKVGLALVRFIVYRETRSGVLPRD